VCEFNAIVVIKKKVLVFPDLCHGCGGCSYICPEGAIREVEKPIGVIEKGSAGTIQFRLFRVCCTQKVDFILIKYS
jgi:MinD superfamily P-loop ATPase